MNEWFINHPPLELLRAVILLIAGLILGKIVARSAGLLIEKRTTRHYAALASRTIFYLISTIFVVMALGELGFSLSVLLGAAGIFTVALGFASQTAVSNVISGIFLLFDHTFEIGDVIEVNGITGEVIAIDFISIKLRTFDNIYVRIPNENVMKAEVKTLTHFPIRRLDVKIGVAYKENIEQVRKILEAVAGDHYLALNEPKPLFIFLGFGDSSLNIQFSIWVSRENFIKLKCSIHEEIKLAFDAAGIEIPFPHITLYSGSVTDPFPVQMK